MRLKKRDEKKYVKLEKVGRRLKFKNEGMNRKGIFYQGDNFSSVRLFFSQNLIMGVFELDFLMVEIDSTPSKPPKAPKILKFDSSNSDFQNFLLNFVKIIFEIPLFS